jgi:arylsulfatase A-like enzyme
LVVLALVCSGLGMLYKGLDGATRVPIGVPDPISLPEIDGIRRPALGPVEPGAGVFTATAPSTAAAAAAGAVCPGCDVVLITVCSLRRDHLGAYGFDGEISPAVDRLADRGVRFNRAYAASNFTLASLTAILTGRYGSATGVTGWDKGLTADVPTLAEVLGNYGYKTGGFTTDAPSGFRPDYGLDRGFQHMEITPAPRNSPDGRHRGGKKEPLGSVARPPIDWLAKQPTDGPVFLMMHTRTAHFPFVVDSPETDPTGMLDLLWRAGQAEAKDRGVQAMPGMAGGTAQKGVVEIQREDPLQARVNALGAPAMAVWSSAYAEAVRRMDEDVELLLGAIKARGRPTVVVLVADHGESLGDHGELLHGDAFFDGVINVPLIFSVTGLEGRAGTRDMVVSQTDILPTILQLVGAVTPAGVDGVSLVPQLKGASTPAHAVVLSEGGVARLENGVLPGAVVSDPWILLKQRRGCGQSVNAGPGLMDEGMPVCLFNMESDPVQNQSVAGNNPDVVADLLERWKGFQSAHGRSGQKRELSAAFIEELQRSGYDFSTGAP